MPGHDDLIPAIGCHQHHVAMRWSALALEIECDKSPIGRKTGTFQHEQVRRKAPQDAHRTVYRRDQR
jgi:RNA polymerase subunit RPABC4/transcription elongation factor Spt4